MWSNGRTDRYDEAKSRYFASTKPSLYAPPSTHPVALFRLVYGRRCIKCSFKEGKTNMNIEYGVYNINLLAPELFFFNLAHMYIKCE